MFRNYLAAALRNLARNRLYAAVNIIGLAVGFSAAILVMLFVRDEFSYDRWIPESENLYRLEVTFQMPGRAPTHTAQTPFPAPPAMLEHIPEVQAMTRAMPWPMTANIDDRQFPATVTVVDPNFLQVMQLPLAQGDAAHVLAQPNSIVISESVARKYFGNDAPLGKVVTVSAAFGSAVYPLKVTGVLHDLPHNTQLVADVLVPNTLPILGLQPAALEQQWTATNGTYGYVALAPGVDPKAVLAKFEPILDRSIKAPPGVAIRGREFEKFQLTRLRDVHLTSDQLIGGMRPAGSRTTVYGLALVALLIVSTACFNFTNLATAQATLRATEVGVRKVCGAERRQLVAQYLGDGILVAVISLLIALALVEILLPGYDRFLDRPISFNYLVEWKLLLMILLGAVVAGLLSGLYPAFVLSGFRPAAALKMSATAQTGPGMIRRALVIFQFAISIALGVVALVVFSQINFARTMEWGFNRDGIVVISSMMKLGQSERESFARTLRAHPQIADVAPSNAVPFDFFYVSNDTIGKPGDSQSFSARIVCIQPEFTSLYGMPLLAGRMFSTQYGEDATGGNVLVNVDAARRLGYSAQEAIGKPLSLRNPARIVGVLGNSKVDGFRERVTATVYQTCTDRMAFLSVRVRSGTTAEALAFIDKSWRAFAPNSAIQRYFMNDAFDTLFEADERQGMLLGIFVGIAIFIACLGLFGLAVFTAARRTQEIGVRKATGAGTGDVMRLLLWQFTKPVIWANLIAWPVAGLLMHRWLQGFAYRIDLEPWLFVASSVAALLIALLTVGAHCYLVARAKPVAALRYE